MNEASLAVAVIGLLKEMGGWGTGALLALFMLMPPLLGFSTVLFGIRAIRSLERTMVAGLAKIELIFVQMATKYDNNIILVEDHQKLVRGHQSLTDNVLDIVKENTKAITLATARMEGMQQGSNR